MDSQKRPKPFRSLNEPAADGVRRRELRVYRPNGALSMIYVMTFGSDGKAIAEAKKIARYGYWVDVWRDGVRIGHASKCDVLARGEDQ